MKLGLNFQDILAINARFLGAAFMGALALLLWPQEPEWWMLGLFAGLLWIGSFVLLWVNLIRIYESLKHDRKVKVYGAQGVLLKGDTHSDEQAQIDAGMIDTPIEGGPS